MHRMRGRLRTDPWAALSRFFFGPSDAQSLNLFRFLYCASVALSVHSEYFFPNVKRRLLLPTTVLSPITLFRLLGIHQVPAQAFVIGHALLLMALLFAAIGLFTRWALTVSWISFLFYYGTIYSVNKPLLLDRIGHITDSVVFVLFILSLSPGIGLWGINGWLERRRWRLHEEQKAVIPAWPSLMVKILLALAYFGAGYSKLHASGILWADGRTLQAYLLQGALENKAGLNLWLAQHLWICVLLSVVALIFEISFWLVVFFPEFSWFYVPIGLVMHAAILTTMSRDYFRYFGCSYWIFLSWPFLARLLRSPFSIDTNIKLRSFHITPESGGNLTQQKLMIGFMFSFVAIQFFCIFQGVDYWPLSSWTFFPLRSNYSRIYVYRIQAESSTGQKRWAAQWTEVVINETLKQTAGTAGDLRELEAWMQNRMIPSLSRQVLCGSRTISLMKRTVRKSSEGQFELVDTPILEFSGNRDAGYKCSFTELKEASAQGRQNLADEIHSPKDYSQKP